MSDGGRVCTAKTVSSTPGPSHPSLPGRLVYLLFGTRQSTSNVLYVLDIYIFFGLVDGSVDSPQVICTHHMLPTSQDDEKKKKKKKKNLRNEKEPDPHACLASFPR